MSEKSYSSRAASERSFTLIETVVALAIIAFLVVSVTAIQGNAVVFSEYGRNISQASFLAQRVMSQVDNFWRTKPFKDLKTHVAEEKFEDFPAYSYSIDINEWKFPFVKLLQSAISGAGKKKKDDSSGRMSEVDTSNSGEMIEQVVKQVFGSEPIFLTATVQVFWAEGAQRNQTTLTYLLTNQAKLNDAISTLKPTYDRLTKPPAAAKPGVGNSTNPGSQTVGGVIPPAPGEAGAEADYQQQGDLNP